MVSTTRDPVTSCRVPILQRVLGAALALAWLAGCQAPPADQPATQPGHDSKTADVSLPASFGDGWQRTGKPRVFAGGDLFNHINGGAELFMELGFARVQVARYARDDAELGLEIYEMKTPAAARALFYHFRGRGKPAANVPGRTVGNDYQVILQKGRFFVQVSNFSGRPAYTEALAALASAVWPSLPPDEPVALLDGLPLANRVARSARIIRGPVGLQALYPLGEGDVLQLKGEHFGVAADYDDPAGGTTTLLVVTYDDVATARAAFAHLCTNLDPYMELVTQTDRLLTFRDYEGRLATVTQRGRMCELRVQQP